MSISCLQKCGLLKSSALLVTSLRERKLSSIVGVYSSDAARVSGQRVAFEVTHLPPFLSWLSPVGQGDEKGAFMKGSSYRDRDYAFGQAIFRVRTTIRLTQVEMAKQLGVSRKAVGE